jgi:hypothetical protein
VRAAIRLLLTSGGRWLVESDESWSSTDWGPAVCSAAARPRAPARYRSKKNDTYIAEEGVVAAHQAAAHQAHHLHALLRPIAVEEVRNARPAAEHAPVRDEADLVAAARATSVLLKDEGRKRAFARCASG